jgi:hypothetical protein
MPTLTRSRRDYAKQSYLSKEARDEAIIEQRKYEADIAVKNLVELLGEIAAKEYILSQRYLPF